jgi:hypothetical protein
MATAVLQKSSLTCHKRTHKNSESDTDTESEYETDTETDTIGYSSSAFCTQTVRL